MIKLFESYDKMKKRLNTGGGHKGNLIETKQQYQKAITNLLNLSENDISVGLSGGALLGIAQYKILKDMIDRGIKPKEYVGNSVGAIIGLLFATGNYDKEYIDFILNSKEEINIGGNFHMLLGKLVPFCFKMQINGEDFDLKTFLIQNYDLLDRELRKYKKSDLIDTNGQINTQIIKSIILYIYNILNKTDKIDTKKVDIKKINFNDIKRDYGTNLRILGTAFAAKSLIKKGKKILRPFIFMGGFPVLDAIIKSLGIGGMDKIKMKTGEFIITDGFSSGNQYPQKENQYKDKESVKILIDTETDFILGHFVFQNFGVNNVIISPKFDGGRFNAGYPFKRENISEFEQIADELIGNENKEN